MASNLSKADRPVYIVGEHEFIEDLLEDATDCIWVYQALIECALLTAKEENIQTPKIVRLLSSTFLHASGTS
jgi:hypothetical protein